VRCLYTVPTALLVASPPAAPYHAAPWPGAATLSLVAVENWIDPRERDAWEALPGILPHYPEALGQPLPLAFKASLDALGSAPTDTLRQVLQKVRTRWPAAWL
jgi:hypothetical protein